MKMIKQKIELKMKTIMLLMLLFVTTTAIHIECEYKMIEWWKFDEMYSCYVKNTVLTGNQSLETVTGAHRVGMSNANVRHIFFGFGFPCGSLDFVPQEIDKQFSSIIGIMFLDCNIQAISGNELKDYKNLESFYIAANPIEKIPGNFFQNNAKLKNVEFVYNKITNVGSNLLTELNQLTHADFFGNVCIDKGAFNRSEVLRLIEYIKIHCPYNDDSSFVTTTTISAIAATEQQIVIEQDLNDIIIKLHAVYAILFTIFLFILILALFMQCKFFISRPLK
jgi:hypothetical protein